MAQREHNRIDPPRPPRYRKRVLAVQAMAGETAWLDGDLYWRDGRVVWQTAQGTRAPAPADLALATRRLNQIARYSIAAAHALGDPAAWLAARHARLALAKALYALRVPDLPALAAQARAHDSAALARLVALLAPEVLCVYGLPGSPAAALVATGAAALPHLCALLEDSTAPPAGRALAALTLGAIHGRQAATPPPNPPPAGRAADWLHQAYNWGRRAGLPADPGLITLLLAAPGGAALAQRYQDAAHTPGPFTLPDPLLRFLLAHGVPAAQLVRLVEAVAAARDVADQVRQYRAELPEKPREKRREMAAALGEQRNQLVQALRANLHAYAQATGDPVVVEQWARTTRIIVARLQPLTPELNAALLAELRAGETLPPALHGPYLELLVATVTRAPSAAAWLKERPGDEAQPVATLLRVTGDPTLVGRAVALSLEQVLSCYTWRDPACYRWVLDAAQALSNPGGRYLSQTLCGMINVFGDNTGCLLLQPLLDAVLAGPPGLHIDVLEATLSALRPAPQAGAHLPRYIPRLMRHLEAHSAEVWEIGDLVSAILALEQALPPAEAATCFDWLLAERAPLSSQVRDQAFPLQLAVPLALAVGDLPRFQTLMRSMIRHKFDYDWTPLEKGIAALPALPALRTVLIPAFPRHTQRVLDLLVRVGLTGRFGPAGWEPLAALDPVTTADTPVPPGWQDLLDLAPHLAPLAHTYRHARGLVSASSDLPTGVRRALDQPARWIAELAYLERQIAGQPARADLATRATNLRARLADTPALRATLAQEAGERLEQIAADAALAAAEHQVRACYRARLMKLAGTLPPDLELDDDWLNATLLLSDITQNRRLLLRLIRSCLAGNRDWPATHPTNQAFLQDLAQYGVDTAAWLDTMPRTYRHPALPGGRLRLYLERDPLRILQMGNYFDTCLSFGGVNAFSTVANACELNKRVIYAADGDGHIVGRKLIGITADGTLIGFRTYTALRDRPANTALQAIFRRYCAAFAARCRLPQADEGTVPRLFAEAWYDDGAVPWQDDTPPPPPGKAAPASPAVPAPDISQSLQTRR